MQQSNSIDRPLTQTHSNYANNNYVVEQEQLDMGRSIKNSRDNYLDINSDYYSSSQLPAAVANSNNNIMHNYNSTQYQTRNPNMPIVVGNKTKSRVINQKQTQQHEQYQHPQMNRQQSQQQNFEYCDIGQSELMEHTTARGRIKQPYGSKNTRTMKQLIIKNHRFGYSNKKPYKLQNSTPNLNPSIEPQTTKKRNIIKLNGSSSKKCLNQPISTTSRQRQEWEPDEGQRYMEQSQISVDQRLKKTVYGSGRSNKNTYAQYDAKNRDQMHQQYQNSYKRMDKKVNPSANVMPNQTFNNNNNVRHNSNNSSKSIQKQVTVNKKEQNEDIQVSQNKQMIQNNLTLNPASSGNMNPDNNVQPLNTLPQPQHTSILIPPTAITTNTTSTTTPPPVDVQKVVSDIMIQNNQYLHRLNESVVNRLLTIIENSTNQNMCGSSSVMNTMQNSRWVNGGCCDSHACTCIKNSRNMPGYPSPYPMQPYRNGHMHNSHQMHQKRQSSVSIANSIINSNNKSASMNAGNRSHGDTDTVDNSLSQAKGMIKSMNGEGNEDLGVYGSYPMHGHNDNNLNDDIHPDNIQINSYNPSHTTSTQKPPHAHQLNPNNHIIINNIIPSSTKSQPHQVRNFGNTGHTNANTNGRLEHSLQKQEKDLSELENRRKVTRYREFGGVRAPRVEDNSSFSQIGFESNNSSNQPTYRSNCVEREDGSSHHKNISNISMNTNSNNKFLQIIEDPVQSQKQQVQSRVKINKNLRKDNNQTNKNMLKTHKIGHLSIHPLTQPQQIPNSLSSTAPINIKQHNTVNPGDQKLIESVTFAARKPGSKQSNIESKLNQQQNLDKAPVVEKPVYIQIPLQGDNVGFGGMSLAQAFKKRIGKLPTRAQRKAKQQLQQQQHKSIQPLKNHSYNTQPAKKTQKHPYRPKNLHLDVRPLNPSHPTHTPTPSHPQSHNTSQFTTPKSRQPSQELLNRLIYGSKAKVSKKEMYALTKKNYENLPEVQEKKRIEAKRMQEQVRMERIKEYQKSIRASRNTIAGNN